MVTLLLMYKRPRDARAFNEHYQSTHIPLLKQMPGLRSLSVSTGQVRTPEGELAFQAASTLMFDSFPDLQTAIKSQESQAIQSDLENFKAGVQAFIYETREV